MESAKEPQRTGVPIWLPANVAVLSVLCLLAPWARTGTVDRSTVGLLSSASALDVWGGRDEAMALAAWYLLPMLAAVAVLAAAWGHPRFSAWSVVPIGPLMVMAWLAVVWSPFDARWGAWLGTASGLTATTLAGFLLIRRTKRAADTT